LWTYESKISGNLTGRTTAKKLKMSGTRIGNNGNGEESLGSEDTEEEESEDEYDLDNTFMADEDEEDVVIDGRRLAQNYKDNTKESPNYYQYLLTTHTQHFINKLTASVELEEDPFMKSDRILDRFVLKSEWKNAIINMDDNKYKPHLKPWIFTREKCSTNIKANGNVTVFFKIRSKKHPTTFHGREFYTNWESLSKSSYLNGSDFQGVAEFEHFFLVVQVQGKPLKSEDELMSLNVRDYFQRMKKKKLIFQDANIDQISVFGGKIRIHDEECLVLYNPERDGKPYNQALIRTLMKPTMFRIKKLIDYLIKNPLD